MLTRERESNKKKRLSTAVKKRIYMKRVIMKRQMNKSAMILKKMRKAIYK